MGDGKFEIDWKFYLISLAILGVIFAWFWNAKREVEAKTRRKQSASWQKYMTDLEAIAAVKAEDE